MATYCPSQMGHAHGSYDNDGPFGDPKHGPFSERSSLSLPTAPRGGSVALISPMKPMKLNCSDNQHSARGTASEPGARLQRAQSRQNATCVVCWMLSSQARPCGEMAVNSCSCGPPGSRSRDTSVLVTRRTPRALQAAAYLVPTLGSPGRHIFS